MPFFVNISTIFLSDFCPFFFTSLPFFETFSPFSRKVHLFIMIALIVQDRESKRTKSFYRMHPSDFQCIACNWLFNKPDDAVSKYQQSQHDVFCCAIQK